MNAAHLLAETLPFAGSISPSERQGYGLGLIAILAAVVVESLAQLFLKIGSSEGGPALAAGAWHRLAGIHALRGKTPWIGAGLAAYGLEIVLYSIALHFLDVSVAFPLGSLCFVGVAILSKVALGETVSRIRWTGIVLILAGTAFIAV
jgi:undecaprenyl phosphate-alpha-L-ara4N flippase subunit ArnE